MIKNPKHGWCTFQLGDFVGTPSYLTDVPLDLLDAFLDYHQKGAGVAVFDEEGSTFTFLITQYNWQIFIIEDKCEAVFHDFSHMDINQLEKELISDIENDLENWSYFSTISELEEITQYKTEIIKKISQLKEFVKK